jgi:uncharacterized protein YbcC (UPF0753/DUF2309 family)
MGWLACAFIGHGSHSANNPFGSSLDCGACAASPGRHNARMLAKIANIPEVQTLKENHNIEIPASTILLEENTIPLQMRYCFSTQRFQTLIKQLQKLKLNLLKTQQTATQERLAVVI